MDNETHDPISYRELTTLLRNAQTQPFKRWLRETRAWIRAKMHPYIQPRWWQFWRWIKKPPQGVDGGTMPLRGDSAIVAAVIPGVMEFVTFMVFCASSQAAAENGVRTANEILTHRIAGYCLVAIPVLLLLLIGVFYLVGFYQKRRDSWRRSTDFVRKRNEAFESRPLSTQLLDEVVACRSRLLDTLTALDERCKALTISHRYDAEKPRVELVPDLAGSPFRQSPSETSVNAAAPDQVAQAIASIGVSIKARMTAFEQQIPQLVKPFGDLRDVQEIAKTQTVARDGCVHLEQQIMEGINEWQASMEAYAASVESDMDALFKNADSVMFECDRLAYAKLAQRLEPQPLASVVRIEEPRRAPSTPAEEAAATVEREYDELRRGRAG